MRINERCFILGIQQKSNKSGEPYLIVNIADSTGTSYSIVSKNLELMQWEQFKPYNLPLELANSQYGLKLDIVGIENGFLKISDGTYLKQGFADKI